MNGRRRVSNKVVAFVLIALTMVVWTLIEGLQRSEDLQRVDLGETGEIAGTTVRVTDVQLAGSMVDEFDLTVDCGDCVFLILTVEVANPTRVEVPLEASVDYAGVSVTPETEPQQAMGWRVTTSVVMPVNPETVPGAVAMLRPFEPVQGVQPRLAVDLDISEVTDADRERTVPLPPTHREVLS